jgi:DNA-binding transcriptional MerR regulator
MAGRAMAAAPRDMSIGELARATGVKVPTIRFYEGIGLLPQAPRTDGNRRLYDGAARARLAFVRHARALGFDLPAIRTLIDLQDKPEADCGAADAIARAHLADVDRKIAALKALKGELEVMVAGCAKGRVADCRVIETLADHSLCATHDHPAL